MAKVLPIIDVLGYDGQNSSFCNSCIIMYIHDGINAWPKFNGYRCYSYHATCKNNSLL